MNNVSRIVLSGVCTGCGACNLCAHIRFEENELGFPVPKVDKDCLNCGACVDVCIYDPEKQEN